MFPKFKDLHVLVNVVNIHEVQAGAAQIVGAFTALLFEAQNHFGLMQRLNCWKDKHLDLL